MAMLPAIVIEVSCKSLSQVKVLWEVLLYSVAVECFRGDSGSKVLWNVGNLGQHYTASQPRRPWMESSLLWKCHILQESVCSYGICFLISYVLDSNNECFSVNLKHKLQSCGISLHSDKHSAW